MPLGVAALGSRGCTGTAVTLGHLVCCWPGRKGMGHKAKGVTGKNANHLF